jgi:5-bromo-4-chloroindolyl phosphate hydrolysis protein
MSVLKSVLIEEKERLEKKVLSYLDLLSQLPKGSIFVRYIGKNAFVYRNVRVKNHIRSIYLGKKDLPKVEEQLLLRKEYIRIKRNLQVAKEELRKLSKVLKVYER